jgi:hypothetical protein
MLPSCSTALTFAFAFCHAERARFCCCSVTVFSSRRRNPEKESASSWKRVALSTGAPASISPQYCSISPHRTRQRSRCTTSRFVFPSSAGSTCPNLEQKRVMSSAPGGSLSPSRAWREANSSDRQASSWVSSWLSSTRQLPISGQLWNILSSAGSSKHFASFGSVSLSLSSHQFTMSWSRETLLSFAVLVAARTGSEDRRKPVALPILVPEFKVFPTLSVVSSRTLSARLPCRASHAATMSSMRRRIESARSWKRPTSSPALSLERSPGTESSARQKRSAVSRSSALRSRSSCFLSADRSSSRGHLPAGVDARHA